MVLAKMQTWKLEIEYDGTRYAGWQRQPHARTVQGELIKAADELFKSKVEIGGSGRTDAGVHALAQVAHLRANVPAKAHAAKHLQSGLNKLLSHDINVLAIRPAPMRFHARHDAVSRCYLYQIATRRTAFGKNYVWWVRDKLDVEAMAAACDLLIGRHDYSSFCENTAEQNSTLVDVKTAQIAVSGDLILFRIGASHFLWKMVRRIVGTLVEAGRHHITVKDVHSLLTRHNNAPAAWTAPPSGLFLERVLYAGDSPLAALKPAFPI